jgi:hypothetical protein
MLRSFYGLMKALQVLAPISVSASTNTAGVNVSDYGSLSFLVNVAAFAFDGTNKLSIILQESDEDVDASYAACTGDSMYDGAEDATTGTYKVLDSTDDQNSAHLIPYRGHKKFARVRLLEAGTVAAIVGVTALLGHAEAGYNA